MLDTTLKTQLQGYLERLQRPILLTATLNADAKSQEMLEFLQEIAQLSPLVSVSDRGEDARAPSFSVSTPGLDTHIRFAAIPLGHEFTSLVLALLQVGGHPLKLAPELIEQVRALEGDWVFDAYVSLSCQNCPDVVQALNVMALINPKIRAQTIDGALFQEEVERLEILSVPSLYLNGKPFLQGRTSVEELLSKLDSGAAQRRAQSLDQQAAFDVLIVGGGPAAAAAAIYTARKGVRTGVLAERFGGQVLDTLAIENFVSVPETEGPRFAAALEEHVRRHEVELMDAQRASALRQTSTGFEVDLQSGATLRAKTVILATGARWKEMNVPGEREYRNRGVAYCPHCDGPLFKGKRVAVVGGGNSGVEAAIDLAGLTEHVTLLEYGQQLRADAILQRKLHSLNNVTVLLNAKTTEVVGDGKRVTALRYEARDTGQAQELALEGVFVQIGLSPNTEWLQDGVQLSARGEIEVNSRGETSWPGVFAAGDATTTPYKQIVIAVGEGAKAALSAFDHLIRLPQPKVAMAAAEALAEKSALAA